MGLLASLLADFVIWILHWVLQYSESLVVSLYSSLASVLRFSWFKSIQSAPISGDEMLRSVLRRLYNICVCFVAIPPNNVFYYVLYREFSNYACAVFWIHFHLCYDLGSAYRFLCRFRHCFVHYRGNHHPVYGDGIFIPLSSSITVSNVVDINSNGPIVYGSNVVDGAFTMQF